jgi:hypothetical protein
MTDPRIQALENLGFEWGGLPSWSPCQRRSLLYLVFAVSFLPQYASLLDNPEFDPLENVFNFQYQPARFFEVVPPSVLKLLVNEPPTRRLIPDYLSSLV